MHSVEIQDACLVHTALEERGDMVVIDAKGHQIDYQDFKERFEGMRLTFPSHQVVRATPNFQIWSFQRSNSATDLLLVRSMISGKSADHRPLPIFEVFRLVGAIDNETALVDCVRGLSFDSYPQPSSEESGVVVRPHTWIALPELNYRHSLNPKRKDWRRISAVVSWTDECHRGVDKLIHWAWHGGPRIKSGVSVCFTEDAYKSHDVCIYYSDTMNASTVRYQIGEYR